MSLINQMLKDLEERSAPQLEDHKDTIRGAAWTIASKPGRRRTYIFATIAASVLCTGIAAGSYYRFNTDAEHGEVLQIGVHEGTGTETRTQTLSVDHGSADDQQVMVKQVTAPPEQHDIAASVIRTEDKDARRMLAALVARGALAADQTKIEKVPPVVTRPVEVAAVETREISPPQESVQKKLHPLDDSKLAEIAYQQGYELLARSQQEEAEKKLLHALVLAPGHTKAREMLAIMYLQQQHVTAAADILKAGMKISPQYTSFREIYARTLMAENKVPEAIAMLKKNIPDLNQQPNYHALLAGLYQQNKQYDDAAALYLKLIKKHPQHSQWWLGMAIAMENLDKKAEAISAYKKARELKLPARLMKYVDSRLQEMDTSHARP